MQVLYDERVEAQDPNQFTRNIWYGDAEIFHGGESGENILNGELLEILCNVIRDDLSSNSQDTTKTNWYFYGRRACEDSIGEKIRPAIMVRETEGIFNTNFTITDKDFARNLDAIIAFKSEIEAQLTVYR